MTIIRHRYWNVPVLPHGPVLPHVPLLETTFIKMTTDFHKTLRPILFLCKSIGLINIAYTVEPTGLIIRDMNSTFLAYLEILRMIVLLLLTYSYWNQFNREVHIILVIEIIKIWIIIIASRLSTIWIIKFINGVTEFDQKITPLSTSLSITQRLWRKNKWNWIFIMLFTFFVGFRFMNIYFTPKKMQNIATYMFVHPLFNPPHVMDYVLTISSCFFLHNIYARFQTLNDIWKCLPADLVVDFDKWTHNEIIDVMENTRLLHSELCELLKMFTLGYGPLLLCFFISNFINMLLGFYFMINYDVIFNLQFTGKRILLMFFHAQSITFLMFIIVFVSFINDERLKIISYLRLYRISILHFDIKRQIKMFMNQISACDSDQISAFGFFDVNLNLVTSILVLLITGIITLVQMKNHPIIFKFNNNTSNLYSKL
ncbi:uncharacterized protein LOC112600814 [Melanaphis sacchari]|uniref:uncharacterized protein LOC112600814 n=1 Tax=Melanaphis sacchari TaxID=742174 RepID=UPI000DC152E2|nr:uncharacterized protein LOC112600814 [Melanaphis sacchari]